MIKLYSGRPGNGKSYHAVDDIYWYLRHGVNIITNIDVDPELIPPIGRRPMGKYLYISSSQMSSRDRFGNFSFLKGLLGFALNFHIWDEDGKTKEGQTVLIIDECQQDDLLNCRTWNNPTRKEWNDFFALHRHYGINVILITQSMSNIDKQAQKLIQHEIEHRKFGNFNGFCLFLCKLIRREIFVCVTRDCSLKRTPSAARMGAQYMISKKKIYKLYNSYTVVDIRK